MVAIYARQSVDKKDSISIETQIELCKRQLPDNTPCVVYPDKGYSGSNINRPEFQRLLADVKAGKIDRILTYRLDRISRSVLDFANLVDLFTKYGVSFNSTQETFDTGTPIGRAMLNIVMTFAQLERETIQIRIRDNYYARGEKGMYLGGPAPFGFRKIELRSEQGKLKLLEPNPETVGTLEQMFQLYGNEMMSLGAVARQFNEKKIPSPGGADWDSCKISRILRNPVAVTADAEVYHYYRDKGVKFTNEVADFTLGKGCYLYGKRDKNTRKFTDVSNHTLSLDPLLSFSALSGAAGQQPPDRQPNPLPAHLAHRASQVRQVRSRGGPQIQQPWPIPLSLLHRQNRIQLLRCGGQSGESLRCGSHHPSPHIPLGKGLQRPLQRGLCPGSSGTQSSALRDGGRGRAYRKAP